MQLISVDELKLRMDAGENLHLVDVRETVEHAEYNIGGQLIPLGKFHTMDLDELDELKDKEVICYCRSGNRSGQACMILDAMGFRDTKNLQGGMLAWKEKAGS